MSLEWTRLASFKNNEAKYMSENAYPIICTEFINLWAQKQVKLFSLKKKSYANGRIPSVRLELLMQLWWFNQYLSAVSLRKGFDRKINLIARNEREHKILVLKISK